jgi:hypothetical protein
MLLIDDLLAAPLHGLFFVLKEINAAVQAELASQERGIIAELGDLHRKLDGNEITEADFEVSEARLLQRLDGFRGDGETDGGGHGHD